MKTLTFKTDFSRRFPDPLAKEDQEGMNNIEHHIFLCRAIDIPKDVPTDPNPRAQDTDKSTYKIVKESLLRTEDPTFHLKNKGITIIAQSVHYAADKKSVDIVFAKDDGIVDGAHTYMIILENQAECPEDQYVKIEVITGLPDYMIEPIAQGLNTAVQVQLMSLANLDKKFDWIKKILEKEQYYNQIAWRENEDGQLSVRDLIALMTLFNIDKFPNETGKHPKIAYTSKASCLKLFVDDDKEASFVKLTPLIKDILSLSDYVQLKGRPLYNEKYEGKAAKMAFYQNRKRGEYEFIFAGETGKHMLYDGALYPILGAFRYLVEQKPDSKYYSWKTGSFQGVKDLFDEVGGHMIYLTKSTSDSRGKNPNAIGKDDNHWDNLYNTVGMAYLKKALKK